MAKPNEPPGERNIEVEYKALCDNLNLLASRRFTLIGFYVAAIGLIAAVDPGREKFVLMLWISVCFWILELRSRGLRNNISDRGMQIERDYWGYSGERAYEPFISHWRKEKPTDNPEAASIPEPARDRASLFFWKLELPRFVTFSLALDLLFFGVAVYSIIGLCTV